MRRLQVEVTEVGPSVVQQWEYLDVTDCLTADSGGRPDLHGLGLDGWELVAAFPTAQNAHGTVTRYLFKRPRAPKEA